MLIFSKDKEDDNDYGLDITTTFNESKNKNDYIRVTKNEINELAIQLIESLNNTAPFNKAETYRTLGYIKGITDFANALISSREQ